MNPVTPLDNIRIVLSHTSHPGNIGAVARAMKTMGLSKLYLVQPKRFPDAQADALAVHASDVLEKAVVCSDLSQALSGSVFSVALSARLRDESLAVVTPRQIAPELITAATHAEVAVVFGTEMSGLTNEEIQLCQSMVMIPANPHYSSLNLAAAVQIVAYELRLASVGEATPAPPSHPLAPFEDVEYFYAHLEKVMLESGFLDAQFPRRTMQRVRRLFARARVEKEEISILRGFLKAVQEKQDKK